MANSAPALAGLAAADARARIRRGEYTGQTAGVGPGMAQGNIAILPADWAEDFLRFCLRNPKPCPLLAVGEPGRTDLPGLGRDIDIRTDVPRYRVFRDGVAVDAPTTCCPIGATISSPSCSAARCRSNGR